MQNPSPPKTRADCRFGYRPCPWARCRYHLCVDVGKRGVALNAPIDDWKELDYTCALDVVEDHPNGLEPADIISLTPLTESMVKSATKRGISKIRKQLKESK